MIFNGAAETDGAFHITGGGNDGGTDTLTGGAGNDTFTMGGRLTATDTLNGGGGNDTVTLNGDYGANLILGAGELQSIETVTLAAGNSYDLTLGGGDVAAGQTMTIGGSSLLASDSLTFDGSAETDGSLVILGGAGNNVLAGGSGADTITSGGGATTFIGGGGSDALNAGSGVDTFQYTAVSDSTGPNYDTITGFDASQDFFFLPNAVTGIDAAASGSLSTASFDSDLATALDAAHLAANTAVLFTANSGTLSGQTFLVVEANSSDGYQANVDYVMNLTGASNLGSLTTGNFLTPA